MRPKVLVHHPGRQHVHHLVYALQEGGYLAKFITSIWYKPDSFPYKFINLLPSKLKKSMENELKKRYHEKIDEGSIEQFPFFEILREGLDRLLKGYKSELGIYLENQIHDWYVARRIDRFKPDIIVGYETSSLNTFKRARNLKITTILDLAQVHYRFIDMLRQKYQEFESIFANKNLFSKVNKLKEEELKYTDYIIALSSFAKETLINYSIPQNRIYTLNLGFELENFKQKGTYRKDGIFKILCVGTITKRKGIHLLLEAYKQLNLRNTELMFIGGIADGRGVLKKYEGVYRYIPYLNHDQLVSYYQGTDVFVLPSYLDSWGMVVIEAMACGTPVIVSENTGAKEAVINGVNGFIIPVDDVSALKEKILCFYNDRDKLEYCGRNARKQAESYTWENYGKRIREIILEIWKDANTSCNYLATDEHEITQN